jgi:HPt (histidine-containing phosphotransfer) domain-containing protein
LARLERAIGEQATEDALAFAHALKGAAANMGLAAISRGALDIEEAYRRSTTSTVIERVAELRRELPATLAAIDAWMGRSSRPGTP